MSFSSHVLRSSSKARIVSQRIGQVDNEKRCWMVFTLEMIDRTLLTCSQSGALSVNGVHGMCQTHWPEYWRDVIGLKSLSVELTNKLIGYFEMWVIYNHGMRKYECTVHNSKAHTSMPSAVPQCTLLVWSGILKGFSIPHLCCRCLKYATHWPDNWILITSVWRAAMTSREPLRTWFSVNVGSNSQIVVLVSMWMILMTMLMKAVMVRLTMCARHGRWCWSGLKE